MLKKLQTQKKCTVACAVTREKFEIAPESQRIVTRNRHGNVTGDWQPSLENYMVQREQVLKMLEFIAKHGSDDKHMAAMELLKAKDVEGIEIICFEIVASAPPAHTEHSEIMREVTGHSGTDA